MQHLRGLKLRSRCAHIYMGPVLHLHPYESRLSRSRPHLTKTVAHAAFVISFVAISNLASERQR